MTNVNDLIPPDEPDALTVPETTGAALQMLATSVLEAIDSLISAWIGAALTDLAKYVGGYLESGMDIQKFRFLLQQGESMINEVKSYRTIIDPYIQYLFVFPEVKKPLTNVLSGIDFYISKIDELRETLERLTYFQSLTQNASNMLADEISQLISLKKFIRNLINKKK